MEPMTIKELMELGNGPLMGLIVYFIWKLDKNFTTLSSEIKLFMRLTADDDADE